MSGAKDVGILAADIYFPRTAVRQEELEKYDGVASGKYTIGLGQTVMGFCSDREDIVSICMNAVTLLMQKAGVDYSQIGFLEVGTETLIDKSKAVKTALMNLFEASGNTDVEGLQSTNACYGGTAALFHAVSWVESSAWDGRLALVVAGDIAVYAAGNARPTGGCGAVAMLVGPDAPMVLEPGLRATHMENAYDFYKPAASVSEYPVVDGQLSINCYTRALDICYARLAKKYEAKTGQKLTLDAIDYGVFHSPFNKLVQKSFARLVFNDFRKDPQGSWPAEAAAFAGLPLEETYTNRELEQAFVKISGPAYAAKVEPSVTVAKEVGNLYTGSLYGGLVSLLCSGRPLEGRRALLFSYGSGLAATMFLLRFRADVAPLAARIDLRARLDARAFLAPDEFTQVLGLREALIGKGKDYAPAGDLAHLASGSYYLDRIDGMYRRTYARKP